MRLAIQQQYMAFVELGKGIGKNGSVNIFGADSCKPGCVYRNAPTSKCYIHNGDKVIVFFFGVTRNTVDEVKKNALCIAGIQ
jgi:hypothetical protein